ncbi:MAG TPA: hypothetical protein VM577_07320 [Anaerovoracaceae bacterium]|nr:hypothetical protein [Anaerovoracaceae bacterium]
METKTEVKTTSFINTAADDGYFEFPDGYSASPNFCANPMVLNNKTASLSASGVVIKVGPNAIGAIQEFSYTEYKKEDGRIGVVGNCSRVFFDKQSIIQVLTGKYDLDDTKFDLDIHYLDRVTTLRNVILSSHHIAFNTNACVVLEEVSFSAENVSTIRVG